MNNRLYGNLIFELSRKGRQGYTLPRNTYGSHTDELPASLRRQAALKLPECDELTVVRHYTNLSHDNFGVNDGFYPLGSCTMKYNPVIDEEIAALEAFAALHPLQPADTCQHALGLYYALQQSLAELTGMKEFTLNPCAGAHGELTGLMVIRAYHQSRGDEARTKVLIPDSAHGTNPASAAVCGLEVVEVKSGPDGLVDGANLNPLLGVCRPGDMGFDVMHVNLHKTFSTPHGGGGPGSGPVGVREGLEPFLPTPRVVERAGTYSVETGDYEQSLGSVGCFFGNFGVMVRAYAYILSLGRENVRMVGPLATLNANYVKESLRDVYELPIGGLCKHEFVFDGLKDKSTGVTTMDVAKRLLDYGYHAPTIYFPLLFHESLMIEPTENESLDTLDAFIQVMRRIAEEAKADPERVKAAPLTTPIGRVDDVLAARQPVVTFKQMSHE